MKYRAIAVDFDNTLAYLDDPGYQNLFRIFIKRGIATAVQMREAYEKIKKAEGFSFEHLINVLTQDMKISLADEQKSIEKEFDGWLIQYLKVYPDSLPAISDWMQEKIPVFIVTAGALEYQFRKISISGIYCNGVITVPRINEKTAALSEIIEDYGVPVLFLDDKASELDALRDRGFSCNQVQTVHVQRSGNSVSVSRYPRYKVQSLAGIRALLQKEEVERG